MAASHRSFRGVGHAAGPVGVGSDHDGPWDNYFHGSVVSGPGALLLAGIGAGLTGYLRRRRAP